MEFEWKVVVNRVKKKLFEDGYRTGSVEDSSEQKYKIFFS